MRSMTIGTAVGSSHGTVPIRRVLSNFLYILVTWVAKVGGRTRNHLRVIGTVRIMATDTIIFCRIMDELIFLQFILGNHMTGKTKLRVFGNQQIFIVGTMSFVTNHTFTNSSGTV